MTRLSTRTREEYSTVGQSAFAYQFQVYDDADLRVIRTSAANVATILALGTHYSVSGVGAVGGGTVTLLSGGLASGERLTIELAAPHTQTTDIRNTGDFQPAVHENAFDKLEAQIQQLARVVGLTPDDAEALRLGYPRSDGSRRYDANNKIIEDLADALSAQHAMNRRSVEAYVASILAGGPAIAPGIAELTPTGTQTQWTVAQISGAAAEAYEVFINGVRQTPYSDYAIDDVLKLITFSTAPPAGTAVLVINRGYAKGYPVPVLYTTPTIPTPGSSYQGQMIVVKDAGQPMTLMVCLCNATTSVWEWVTVAIGPIV